MRWFWLLLILTLAACSRPAPEILVADSSDPPAVPAPGDAEPSAEEPAVPEETPHKVHLTLNLGGHTATVTRVFFTPDSKQVISVSADHSIRVWDALSGQSVKVLYPPGYGGIAAAALSPDGRTLAVGSRYPDGDQVLHVIYLVALADGSIQQVLRGHPQAIEAIAYSPDGKRLASTSAGTKEDGKGKEGTVLVWDLATGQQQGKGFDFLGNPSSAFYGVTRKGLAFSPDGQRLARVRWSGGSGGILDLTTRLTVPAIKFRGNTVAWSPDGKTLAVALTANGGIQLWNMEEGKAGQRLLDKLQFGCYSVTFSADSRTLLTTWGPNDRIQAGIFDVASGKLLVSPRPKVGKKGEEVDVHGGKHGALSPDGQLAATTVKSSRGAHGLRIWKTADGSLVKEVWPDPAIYQTVDGNRTAWSKDGKAISWNKPGNPFTFHLDTLQLGRALPKGDLPGQSILQQGALSVELKPWPRLLKEGQLFAKMKGYHPTLVGPDRAASTEHGVIHVYDTTTGEEVRQLPGHHDLVNNLLPSPDGRFLLSTSLDQTVKIWNVKADQPLLLSLYSPKGNDWIVWTPEGYYAASAGGERLISWRAENGIDRSPTIYGAERFRKQFYRPDVIERLRQEGSVARALKEANAARGGARAHETKLEEALPPQVALEVVDKSALPKLKLKVVATARSKSQPVTALHLLVDGRAQPAVKGLPDLGQGRAKVDESLEVTLPGKKDSGPYRLAMLAIGPDSSARSEVVEVSFLQEVKKPVMHVLAIGIDKYKASGLKLNAAADDAREICATFKERSRGELFREVIARPLLDGEANRKGVLAELERLRKEVKVNDLVVVFFAGHGVKTSKGLYLLTVEADPKNDDTLQATALSGAELQKHLGGLPCQVLLLLDACHSGTIKTGFRSATDDLTRVLTDDEVGVVVLCAALGHEKAEESTGHGLFTLAVVEALRQEKGVPFHPVNRQLYVHHLYSYVADRVSILSSDRQHPYYLPPALVPPFALAQFPRKAAAGR